MSESDESTVFSSDEMESDSDNVGPLFLYEMRYVPEEQALVRTATAVHLMEEAQDAVALFFQLGKTCTKLPASLVARQGLPHLLPADADSGELLFDAFLDHVEPSLVEDVADYPFEGCNAFIFERDLEAFHAAVAQQF